MNRLAALHAWPVFSIRASTAAPTEASRSSEPSSRNGSEPPSSRTTFLRLRPAVSATAAPARSEPVSETPLTLGSAIASAICSLDAYTLTYAPAGKPASSKMLCSAAADSGHCGACLRMIVLPITRFGPANRATW